MGDTPVYEVDGINIRSREQLMHRRVGRILMGRRFRKKVVVAGAPGCKGRVWEVRFEGQQMPVIKAPMDRVRGLHIVYLSAIGKYKEVLSRVAMI